jgi:hypothetical protein
VTRMLADVQLEREIAALGDLCRGELAERWLAIYGTEPPKGARRPLLERAIAWHLQADAIGRLTPNAKRALDHAVREEQRRRADTGDTAESIKDKPDSKRRPLPPVGARMIREWGGKTHVVEMVEGGYLWNGAVHASLSAIARSITGARWSGPRFFGL